MIAIAASLLMVHLVYVHKELLYLLNPEKATIDRNITLVFSITFAFVTILAITRLRNMAWNIAFALFDTVSMFLYYGRDILIANQHEYILVQSIYYAVFTGISTFVLGHLCLRFFDDEKQVEASSEHNYQQIIEEMKTNMQVEDERYKELAANLHEERKNRKELAQEFASYLKSANRGNKYNEKIIELKSILN